MLKPVIQFIIMFTMFFNGGLIPIYLNIKDLGLYNSLWALILPGAVSVYNSIICRTAIQAVPESLHESASLDGANDFTILFRIIFPLIMPTVAVLLLYYGIGHWNAWFPASIYLKDNNKLPIQNIMRSILIANSNLMEASGGETDKVDDYAGNHQIRNHRSHNRSGAVHLSLPAALLRQGRHDRRSQGLRLVSYKEIIMENINIPDLYTPELKHWLNTVWEKLCRKMPYAVEKARQVSWIPYTTRDGQWAPNSIDWWTNGFWPAAMWQMYLGTENLLFREEAIRAEKKLDEALNHYDALSHDMGFMWLIQSGVRYALEGNEDSRIRTMRAAEHLACRFNPNGFIRAWNGTGREGWAIIDCMMNLPLLYWASQQTGDPRFRLIAMRHADKAMETFVRPDGSCNHIVCFDPETGDVLETPGGQGYASGSSWSRGQAWALYGFTLSWLHTRKTAYLSTAKRVANYYISQVADDHLPRCDFRQPAELHLLDNASGAIAAAGLLLLARQLPENESLSYARAAVRLLQAMEKECANWDLNDPAILQKCTSAWHDVKGRHITMVYGDYYFIEAIQMLRGQTMLFWDPARTAPTGRKENPA